MSGTDEDIISVTELGPTLGLMQLIKAVQYVVEVYTISVGLFRNDIYKMDCMKYLMLRQK